MWRDSVRTPQKTVVCCQSTQRSTLVISMWHLQPTNIFGDQKLAWTQAVDLLKGICEEEERNSERAIVDEGPYRIRGPFSSRLQVPCHSYIAKSHAEKERINTKIYSLSLEELQAQNLPVASRNRSSKQNGKSLTECAYINIPKSAGRKPGEAERRRRQRSRKVAQRLMEGYRGTMSIKPEPVHYHPKLEYIGKAHGQRFKPEVRMSAFDRDAMDDIHHTHLQNEFGLWIGRSAVVYQTMKYYCIRQLVILGKKQWLHSWSFGSCLLSGKWSDHYIPLVLTRTH